MKRFQAIVLAAICIITFTERSAAQSNMPVSKEAVFIETYSPTEVTIKAKGIAPKGFFTSDIAAVEGAENDARKSAVLFVLQGMTDALLTTEQEKNAFAAIQEGFFNLDNINTYITYMGNDLISRVNTKDGLKIEKLIRVNKEKLAADLVVKGILKGREALAESIGNPSIMVIPDFKKGESPIQLLQTNPLLKKGAEIIESYLTARKYDVLVPEQQANLEDLNKGQQQLGGREEDYAYQLALSVGSDVYITYNVSIEPVSMGRKAVVGCRAFETTTARLLGTETGYSPSRPSAPDAALVEEGMKDAIDRVLARIASYWKDDMTRGVQYKLVVSIGSGFSEDKTEEIQFAFQDAVQVVAKKSKENIVTKQTLDYLIWCDVNKFDKTSKVYREVKKVFDKANLGTLRQVNINRKMILLKIDPSQ